MATRLTQIEGFVVEGDVFAVDWAAAEGRFPTLVNRLNWPLPPTFRFRFGAGEERVIITDQLLEFKPGYAFLRPPSLVVGLHPAPNAKLSDIERLLVATFADNKLARSSLIGIATIHYAGEERSMRRLGYPIRSFSAERLNRVRVPNPSKALETIVGTRNVCEASALVAAGKGARLLVERTRSPVGTIAIARRLPPVDVVVDLSPVPMALLGGRRSAR